MKWQLVSLENVVNRLTNGYVGPTRNIYQEAGVPYILARQIKNNILKFDGKTHVSIEFNEKNRKSKLKEGDVLLVQSGHIGHSAVVPSEHEGHNCHALIVITPKKELLGQYLSLYFSYLLHTGKIQDIKSGSTVPHLTCKLVRKLQLPLPSIIEQKRIVTILDETFSGIDIAIANTQKNLANTRELFESYLTSIFLNLPAHEKIHNLGDICDVIGGGTPAKNNASFYSGNIPWATVRDMKKDSLENTEFKITKDAVGKSSTNVIGKNNVVIATRVGLGKVCLLKQDTAINQDLRGVIPKNADMLDMNFLFWWFKSISKKIEDEGTGATVKGVKLPFVKSLQIPLPPIQDQAMIATKIFNLSTDISRIEAIYQKKLLSLADLKQSLLQKAFSGELTSKPEPFMEEVCA